MKRNEDVFENDIVYKPTVKANGVNEDIRSKQQQNGHVQGKTDENEAGWTFWLVFSVVVAVFGNSFLYGYNIGVVNSPAKIIQDFYGEVYAERNGIKPDKHILSSSSNVSTTTVTVVIGSPGQNNTGYNIDPAKANNVSKSSTENEGSVDDNFLDLMWSITVAIFVLFGMFGAFASGKIADFFGRKRGMIIITFIMFLAAVFGAIPKAVRSPECLIVSRAFVGLHCGINISLASLYLAEISPKKIRGAVGTFHQLFITIGILWSMILGLPGFSGSPNLWPFLFAFNAIPAFVCLVVFPFCPESPRFLLIKKNDEDGATKALRRLRGRNDVENEIEEMRSEAKKASSIKQFTLKELLTTPELKLPIIIACLMQVAQQWSGINAVMSYSAFIFQQAKIEESAIPYVIVGQGAINVIATIIAIPLMEKAGRRALLLGPMGLMVGSFVVLTIFLNLLNNTGMADSHSAFAIVCIVAMLSYIIGFALGLGPIPFIVVSEIFRQEPRAAAMSFSLAFNWVCNFILVLTFRFIQKGIGPYTYLIFIVILVASILFIFFFLPETKNRSFDEIASSIGFRHKRKWQPDEDRELQPMGNQKV
ncbi:hypothetical protein CHS0354_030370 [Potamilus streckersoni]|uniref:Major facilitator superfamily (MFS) profile domain-containing protein n=1 Tax=Potamilus streckersoni TaxID=2493646 RepID=A0AAE0T4U8_9BIVA|nr:hypothetical protein CHS0354_030370 [Potamilus streckersoni]